MIDISSLDLSHLQNRRTARAHLQRNFLTYSIFIVLSIIATLYSLGYVVNWQTGTVQQTGLITLDSRISNLKPEIWINNQKVGGEFPYRFPRAFPGSYTVLIKKDGYQLWERHLQVEPNKVASFPSIVLILEQPKIVSPEESRNYQVDLSPDKEDLEIRENELWIKGKFITRSSEDILAVRWYPDRRHVVYQSGADVLLTELDGLNTQKLLTLDYKTRLLFSFRDGGRVLVYQIEEVVYALELYQRS